VESTSPSLRRRIALAIALTVAFYVLALGLLAALLALATVHLALTIACGLAAIALLRGVFGRRKPYVPPGPALTREAQPELHALLDDVAARAGDAPVDDVYLAHEVNAGVLEVPKGLLRGRRRVLELGLPLMQVVDRDAFTAIVAHEHGHYVGGDTRYSLWIGRTRAAIGRTIHRMTDTDRIIQSLMAYPFRWYGSLFLRITAAVSRRQEHAADALAVRTAGADAHGRALVTLARAALAFDPYVEHDLEPALQGGVHPPIADGLRRMMAVPDVRAGVDDAVRRRVAEEEPHPRDTHPTLAQRLAAIGVEDPAAVAPAPEETPPAIDLLRDLPALERGLLNDDQAFEAVSWEQVGDAAIAARARAFAMKNADVLEGRRVGDAGALAYTPREVYDRAFADDPPTDDEEHAAAAQWVVDLLVLATIAAAARAGWTIVSLPGQPYALTRGDARLTPGPALWAVLADDEPVERWTTVTEELGLADLPLAPPPEEDDAARTATGLAALEQRAAMART
jgi:heat shock protein HtpX